MKLLPILIIFLAGPVSAEPWYYTEDNNISFQIPDKVQHYWGSYMLSTTLSPESAFLAGFLWEVKQKIQGGEFGEKDLLLDLLGSYKVGFVSWNQRDEYWTLNVTFGIGL